MELYYVISIIDRDKTAAMAELYKASSLTLPLTHLGIGTATNLILSANGLAPTEKTVMGAIAGPDSLKALVRGARRKLSIDIPGNGILMAIPIKSIGGRTTLSYITDKTTPGQDLPEMQFAHELIVVILNEGHSDEVMDAARSAGATGGTILHAKGTGAVGAKPFFGVSLAEEKDVIYIAARAENKADIMRAINASAGTKTPAGAISFSLPISKVVGLRVPDEDEATI